MQKNLSGLKHLRLTSSDEVLMSDLFHRDGETDEKIIPIKKEGFAQQKRNSQRIFRSQNIKDL